MKTQFRSYIINTWHLCFLCNPSKQPDFFSRNFSRNDHSLNVSPTGSYLLLLFREYLCLVLIIIIINFNAFNFKNYLIIIVIVLRRLSFSIDILLYFFKSHKQDTNKKIQQKEWTKQNEQNIEISISWIVTLYRARHLLVSINRLIHQGIPVIKRTSDKQCQHPIENRIIIKWIWNPITSFLFAWIIFYN